MEEKLRNLSQNIENNTGDNAHKPEETPPPEEHHEEEFHEEEHHEEEHHEEEPREEEHHEEEHHEEEHHDEEPHDEEPHDEEPHEDDVSDYTPEPEEAEKVDIDFKPVKEQEEQEESEKPEAERLDDDGNQPESSPSRKDDSDSSEAKILTMDEEEPKESPTRTKKYSPEVEAALNRLNSDEVSADFGTEPLSTEPKKQHHIGRIFVCFLLILAIAATAICVLVEQKVIDNPLNWFDKKSSSNVETTTTSTTSKTTTEPVALTDQAFISAIDAIFKKHVTTDNYYIFNRTSQTLEGKNYIYYDVAETPAVDCAETATDCANAEKVTNLNYQNYDQFRYTFVATDFDVYEFEGKTPLEQAETLNDVTTNLNQTTTNKE